MRCPLFQTATLILEKDGQRWVKKMPLAAEAERHVKSFIEKEMQLCRLYKNVQVANAFEEDAGGTTFPYIQGEHVGSMIESELDSLDCAISQIKKYMEMIDDFHEDMVVDFQISKEFEEVFGSLSYQGKAVKIANVDEILDNFLIRDNKLVLIDYEWVFFSPVPVRYIQFRTIFYFLVKNYSIITPKMSEKDFLGAFGYCEEEIGVWKKMDDHFQEYVHGENHKYMYPLHYEREIRDINYLLNHVPDIGGEFARTREELEKHRHLLEEKGHLLEEKGRLLEEKEECVRKLELELEFERNKNFRQRLKDLIKR